MKKDKNPTSAQWAELLMITEPVFKSGCGKLNMDEGFTSEQNICETVLCVGGFAAIAFGLTNPVIGYHWHRGADAIARTLGFRNRYYLQYWAAENPTIWGRSGDLMFYKNKSYTDDKHMIAAKNLSDIWNHWKRVLERTIEREQESA